MKIMLSKALVLIVVSLFLLTGLSSVYAGSVLDMLESKKVDKPEPMEIESHVDTCREPGISYPFPDKHELRWQYYNHHPSRHYPLRKSTQTGDEDWDIVVPDDYPTIQMAVDIAGSVMGYNIYVRNGTYHENIVIRTDGITLHGEDKHKTIIEGEYDKDIIQINANYLNISSFTITDSKEKNSGINIYQSSGNTISDNNINGNIFGITITNHSHANNIINNEITNNIKHGIEIKGICTGNNIKHNLISNNTDIGIFLNDIARVNIVSYNTISYNRIGVNCTGISDGNIYYFNYFIDNILNAFDNCYNIWDNELIGNYWSDYTGVDIDNNGIGDTPYYIPGGENKDNYPLIKPLSNENIQTNYNQKNNVFLENKEIIFQTTSYESGDIINVPEDYPTIQKAVDNSSDGDTIHIGSGVYYENVIIDKSLKIEGEGVNETKVSGKSEDFNISEIKDKLQVSQEKDSGDASCLLENEKIVQGFVYQQSLLSKIALKLWRKGSPTGLTISIRNLKSGENLSQVYIQNPEIPETPSWIEFDLPDINISSDYYYICLDIEKKDNFNTICWMYGDNNPYYKGVSYIYKRDLWQQNFDEDYCFKIYGRSNLLPWGDEHVFKILSDQVEISDLTIKECSSGFSGIRVFGNNCYLHDLFIQNCGGGIELWETNNSIVKNNILINNVWGIYLHRTKNCYINGNIVNDNIYGIELGFSEVIIDNNTFNGNLFHGILVMWCDNNQYYSNSILNTFNRGIEMFSSNYNKLKYNVISNNLMAGISLFKSTHNAFNNNTIQDHFSDFTLTGCYGIQLVFFSKNNNISNNNFIKNLYGIELFPNADNNNICYNNFTSNYVGIIIESYFNIVINNIFTLDNKIIVSGDSGIHCYGILNLIFGNIIISTGKYGNNVGGGNFGIYSLGFGHLIINNTISKCLVGIYTDGFNNKIENNNILNNLLGLELTVFLSTCHISKNNFIGNFRNAKFVSFFPLVVELHRNSYFVENYWGRPIYHPKPIFGKQMYIIPGVIFDYMSSEEPFKPINYQEFDKLDQYQIKNPVRICINNNIFAQSFVSRYETLSRVDLGLLKIGNPGGLKLSIKRNLSDDNLTSIYIPDSQIIDNALYWIRFDFPDINITTGEKLYFICKPINADKNNTYYFHFGYNDPYKDGETWEKIDDNWEILNREEYDNLDFCFITWGK